MARDRLIAAQPDAAAGAIRAVVKTQQALKVNPALVTPLGRRLFPHDPYPASIVQMAKVALRAGMAPARRRRS